MPTTRRRKLAKRTARHDRERVLILLETGHDFEFLDDHPPLNDDQLREAWLANRDKLPADCWAAQRFGGQP